MITFSAVRSVPLWETARALHSLESLAAFYSGVPRWSLPDSGPVPVVSHPGPQFKFRLRTLMPQRMRPVLEELVLARNDEFDRQVAGSLSGGEILVGIPGQCLRSFKK